MSHGRGRLVVVASGAGYGEHMPVALGPLIKVDGDEVGGEWGENPFDVDAGEHRLFVSTRYLGGIGPAELDVTVRAGAATTVYYQAPMGAFGRATLDRTPPESDHSMPVAVVLAVFVLVLVAGLITVVALV